MCPFIIKFSRYSKSGPIELAYYNFKHNHTIWNSTKAIISNNEFFSHEKRRAVKNAVKNKTLSKIPQEVFDQYCKLRKQDVDLKVIINDCIEIIRSKNLLKGKSDYQISNTLKKVFCQIEKQGNHYMPISQMRNTLCPASNENTVVEDFIDHDNRYLGFGAIFHLKANKEYEDHTLLLELTTTIRIGQEDSLSIVIQQNFHGEFRLKALGVFTITSSLAVKKFLELIERYCPETKLVLVNLDSTVLEATNNMLSTSSLKFLVSKYSIENTIEKVQKV